MSLTPTVDNYTVVVEYCGHCNIVLHGVYDECPDCGGPIEVKEVE